MNIKKSLCFSVAILLFIAVFSAAQDDKTDYFNQGIVNYIRGDLPEAVVNLEKAYNRDPSDERIKTFYLKTLVEMGTMFYEEGDYAEAKPYLERAHNLAPQDKQVEMMYKIATGPEKETTPIAPALEGFRKEQEKVISGYLQQEDIFNKIIEKLDTERQTLKEIMSDREEAIKKDIMGFVTLSAAVVLGLAVILVLLFLWYRKKEGQKTEALLSHQESIIKKMQAIKDARPENSKSFKIDQSERGVITDINTSIRQKAKRVEMLEDELLNEKDPSVAEKLLDQYLNDSNNRIKANAAKALYPHNSRLALEILAEMLLSYDRWMRTSAVWVLGELATEDAAKLLLSLKNEDDPNVISQLKESIKRIIDSGDISKE
ncbi:MAG: HEAT repeat domain-containing protein, partial [Elusimicrobiota bacterium]